jgi:transcriptional regulator with XRE-family HTH domain
MVRRARTERAASSKAVRELRELIGYSQTELAGSLDVSLGTVARWETSRPPRGEHLLSLSKFALDYAEKGRVESERSGAPLGEHDLWERLVAITNIGNQLLSFYMAEVIATSPVEFMSTSVPDGTEKCLLMTKLEGEHEVELGKTVETVVSALRARSPRRRQMAIEVVRQFCKLVESGVYTKREQEEWESPLALKMQRNPQAQRNQQSFPLESFPHNERVAPARGK